MIFPHVETESAFFARFKDDAHWLPATQALLEHHRIPYATLERVPFGSNLIWALDQDRILKVFPPLVPQEHTLEVELLERVHAAALGLPTPQLLAHGVFDGWGWGLLQRLHGERGSDVWGQLEQPDRLHVVAQLGDWMAASWESSSFQSARLPPSRSDWEKTQRELRHDLLSKNKRQNLPQEALAQVEAFMQSWQPRHETRVIHADLHSGNVLLARQAGGRWGISGVLDFADTLAAPPIYDLGAALYFTQADPQLCEALYHHAMGADHGLTARDILQWFMLHRFGHIAHMMSLDFIPKNCRDLDTLAHLLSGLQ